ncbi:cysteine-rich CWC family protein [Lentibacillus populi]|uniref:cysteine-rich CWC family protein n=1 Tax=Lentibacillus populi TaxID=1827502 RepID=UPI0016684ADA|nr:cysteine-rich CWC family protein [Lentibacillus populi]
MCHKPNNCGVNNQEKDCWCTTVDFPTELFSKIPEEDLGKICICMDCVRKAGEE